jgi:uncharacterized protein YheU (UPF0270 family)
MVHHSGSVTMDVARGADMTATDGRFEEARLVLDDECEQQLPVAVPHTELSPEALRGVVEAFVLREGTDYGERDVPFETKVAQVIGQIERGEARIMFDPTTQSVQLVAG